MCKNKLKSEPENEKKLEEIESMLLDILMQITQPETEEVEESSVSGLDGFYNLLLAHKISLTIGKA